VRERTVFVRQSVDELPAREREIITIILAARRGPTARRKLQLGFREKMNPNTHVEKKTREPLIYRLAHLPWKRTKFCKIPLKYFSRAAPLIDLEITCFYLH